MKLHDRTILFERFINITLDMRFSIRNGTFLCNLSNLFYQTTIKADLKLQTIHKYRIKFTSIGFSIDCTNKIK